MTYLKPLAVALTLNLKSPTVYNTEHFNKLLILLRTDAVEGKGKKDYLGDHLDEVAKLRYNTILRVLKEICEKYGVTLPTLPPGEFEILD